MKQQVDIGNGRLAVGVFFRMVLSTFFCLIMFFSMSVLSVSLFGKNVGYVLYEYDKDGKATVVEQHRYEAGEEEIDASELPSGQRVENIREVPASAQTGVDILVQLMMLAIVAAFPYSTLWSLGDKDANGVRFHRKKPQLFRGLIIGCLGNIPYFVLYVLLFVSKLGVISPAYLGIYRLINLPFLPYINMVVDTAVSTATDAAVWQLLALLPVVLVIPAVSCGAYILGYKEISLRDRIVYAGRQKTTVNTGNDTGEI